MENFPSLTFTVFMSIWVEDKSLDVECQVGNWSILHIYYTQNKIDEGIFGVIKSCVCGPLLF